MKRVVFLLGLICLLFGCGISTEPPDVQPHILPRMVRLDGVLYLDSGRESANTPRCGVMDGEITSQVAENEIPTKDGEANFDAGDGYQIGSESDTIELNLDGAWRIFVNAEKPPEMRVLIGEETFPSLRGEFSWTSIATNGKDQTIIADALHPLESQDLVPILTLRPSVHSSRDPHLAYLEFSIPPNKITARRWSASDWGDPTAQGEAVAVESSTVRVDAHYIYEITAEWNLENGFGGAVRYSFYTKAAKLCAYPLAE